MAIVREQTIPTERPPLIGEVSANFYAERVQEIKIVATDGTPKQVVMSKKLIKI
jgi:hypothetical protein